MIGKGPTAREGHAAVAYGDLIYVCDRSAAIFFIGSVLLTLRVDQSQIVGGYTEDGYVSDVHVLDTGACACAAPGDLTVIA